MRCTGVLAGALVFLAVAVVAADRAEALQITLSGPTVGPLTAGLGVEDALAPSSITFTVGLDAAAAIQGYDVTMSWDPSELSFAAASDLSGIGFTLAPSGTTPSGERVASIALPSLSPVNTALLFSATFDVTAVVHDGAPDFAVFVDSGTNGGGIAPGALGPIGNPAGAAIAVPEPATASLFLLALATLGSRLRCS